MSLRMFPRALVACFALGLCAASAQAQTDFTRPRKVMTTAADSGVTPTLENEPVVISLADEEEDSAPAISSKAMSSAAPARRDHLQQMLLAAIELRIGTPYRMGATGPTRYDCSGFVWSVFQSAGINFERTNARSLWTNYAPPREDEKYKLGTLVFFNHLNHVGIVADEHGFYHASSSRGVVYSPFNEYWTARIVGFRRIALPQTELVAAIK